MAMNVVTLGSMAIGTMVNGYPGSGPVLPTFPFVTANFLPILTMNSPAPLHGAISKGGAVSAKIQNMEIAVLANGKTTTGATMLTNPVTSVMG